MPTSSASISSTCTEQGSPRDDRHDRPQGVHRDRPRRPLPLGRRDHGAAAAHGHARRQAALRRYAATQLAAQGSSNAQWLDQGDKNPHSAAHYGNYAFKPLGPLGFFDGGIVAYAGTTIFMEAHKQNFPIARPASDTSAIARFGELSGASILQLLLPLLVILLGFTAFAGERESGTLRQVLSMGTAPSRLLWGKALGLAAAVAVVVLPCLLAGALVIAASGLETVGGGLGTRVALLALGYGLYAAIFLFLTLAVSARASSPRAALMALVGFWAFSAFLMPKIAGEISKVVHPSPAYGTFMAEMKEHQRRGIDGVSPNAKLGRYQGEMYRKYGVKRVEDLPFYWTAVRMQKLEELDQPVFDQHYGAVRDAYTAQQRLQDGLGLVAPTLALRSLSTGLVRHQPARARQVLGRCRDLPRGDGREDERLPVQGRDQSQRRQRRDQLHDRQRGRVRDRAPLPL
jgi:ABC-2 type transport system permease protein